MYIPRTFVSFNRMACIHDASRTPDELIEKMGGVKSTSLDFSGQDLTPEEMIRALKNTF